jgi:hypothetical protein
MKVNWLIPVKLRWVPVGVCLIFTFNHAQITDVLFHQPPSQGRVGEDLEITVAFLTPVEILEGSLYYREAGTVIYRERPLRFLGDVWVGTIPGNELTEAGVEYVVVFRTISGGVVATPKTTPFENPHFVPIRPPVFTGRTFPGSQKTAAGKAIAADILILSPEPGALVHPEDVVVAASLFNVPYADTTTIRLFIDGVDYTSQIEVGGGVINLVPEELELGFHTVRITMATVYGIPIEPVEWSFTVAKPGLELLDQIAYSGEVSTRLSTEYVGDQVLNISELLGKVKGGVSWISAEGDFRLTSRESPYQQPLNRLTGNINLGDYLSIDFGDFNPRLNSFSIDGKRIRGLGVHVKLPWVRFQLVQGELNRAVQWTGETDEGYLLLSDDTEVDSLNRATYFLDRRGYTFRRTINAYRMSVDIFSNAYVSLQLLKAKDEVNSVERVFSGRGSFTVDTLAVGLEPGVYTYDEFRNAVQAVNGQIHFPEKGWGGGDPADNLVIGVDLGSTFDQRKLVFEFSWNMSLYNRNIWDGAMTRTQMDTTLDDSLDGFIGVQYDENGLVTGTPLYIDTSAILDPTAYEGIFTINAYMTPLVPFDFTAFEKHPVATVVNMPSSAFHLRLKGHYSRHNFLVEYRQIGPEYVSLGNPYLTNNLREFVIQDRIALMESKLLLSAGYKHRDNKISRTTVDPLITNTFFASVTLVPGPDVPSLMFNIQSVGKDNEKEELEPSGIDLRENTRTVNSLLSINFPLTIGTMKHNLVVNYSEVNNKDILAEERKRDYLFQKTDTKTYSINLTSRFASPFSSTLSLSRTELFLPTIKNGVVTQIPYIWTAVGINGQYLLWNNTLQVMGGLSYLNSAGSVESRLYGIKLGGDYKVIENLHVSLSGNLQLNQTPVYANDKQDNDGDGKQDELFEAWELNTSGLLLTVSYRF